MADKTEKNGQLTFDFLMSAESAAAPAEEWEPEEEILPGLVDPQEQEEEQEMAEEIRESMNAISEPAADTVSENTQAADDAAQSEAVPQKKVFPFSRKNLKRAALAFLASLNPDGLAFDFTIRRKHIDGAAFWFGQGPRKGTTAVTRTALIEIRTRQEASIENKNHAEQISMLRMLHAEKENLEASIRTSEPELRDDSTLFNEFEHWNYRASKNPLYKECLQKIEKLEHTIFHGSRLEYFRSAGVASELYLVVPEKSISPEDVPETWGVVYIKEDLSFELVKVPGTHTCRPEHLMLLACHIGAAAKENVLFANGIKIAADQSVKIGPLPHKRRSC